MTGSRFLRLKSIFSATLAIAFWSQIAVSAPTANNTLYISGYTGLDRPLFEAILDQTNGVCDDTNPINVYSTAAVAATTPVSFGNWLIHCTARDTATFGAGTEIGIAKSSQGSDYGIYPVAMGSTFLPVNGATGSVTTVTTTCVGTGMVVAADVVNSRLAYTHFDRCSTVTTQVPQVGVSEVEPALMGYPQIISRRVTANGAVTTPYTMFVSKNFYRALQAAQGLTGSCATDTADTQTDACTPSLTTVQIRAILSGYLTDVTNIFGGSTALTAPPGGSTILVCRRGNNSGSQRAVERLFFNQNCKNPPIITFTSDASVFNASSQACLDVGCTWSDTNALTTGVAVNFVFQGTSTGDVERCMNYAARTGGGDVFAVGIASADRAPNDMDTTFGKQYRYIKIDGVLPTVENVLAQRWQHTIENVVLTPTAASPNSAAYNTGFRRQIAMAVLGQLRVPANLAKSHITYYTIGRIGLTARPSTSQSPAATDSAAVRPLAPFIRASSPNAPVNNCNENVVPGGAPVKVNP